MFGKTLFIIQFADSLNEIPLIIKEKDSNNVIKTLPSPDASETNIATQQNTSIATNEMVSEINTIKKDTGIAINSDTISDNAKIISASNANFSKSLFSNHLLKADDFNPKLKIQDNQYWLLGLLFLIFILYVWLKVMYEKKLKEIFAVFIGSRAVNQQMREEYSSSNRFSVFLSILFILVTSLFIYQLNIYYKWDLWHQTGFVFYIELCTLIFSIHFIKIWVIKLFGFILKTENEAAEYAFNILLFNKILGLVLLPLTIFIEFIKQIPVAYFINTGLILIALMLFYRIVYGLIIAFSYSKFSKFYLFVYLCALELLPLIVLIKVFITRS